jgi:hypothetical protein
VVAALHGLFAALEGQERERLAAEQGNGSRQQHSVANPNALREALSALPGNLFRVGE